MPRTARHLRTSTRALVSCKRHNAGRGGGPARQRQRLVSRWLFHCVMPANHQSRADLHLTPWMQAGEKLVDVAEASAADVDRAVRAAKQVTWGSTVVRSGRAARALASKCD